MVGTIAPLVKVAKGQWLISTSGYLLASVLSGGTLGVLLGGLGALALDSTSQRFSIWLLTIIATTLALVEMRVIPLTIPTLHRSVPQHWWIRYGPTKAALAYGGVLGTGVTTFNPLASFYIVPVAATLLGPVAGGLIGASYGFGRALAVPMASLAIAGGAKPVAVGRWIMSANRRHVTKVLCSLGLIAVSGSLLIGL